MPASSSSKPDMLHLRKHHRRYWYIRHIPKKLSPWFDEPHTGKNHFLVALETTDHGKALRQRPRLNALYELMLDKARRKIESEPDKVMLGVEATIRAMLAEEDAFASQHNGEGFPVEQVWHQTFDRIGKELGAKARAKAVQTYATRNIVLTDAYVDDWIRDDCYDVTVDLQKKRRAAVILLAKFLDGKAVDKLNIDDARNFIRDLSLTRRPGTVKERIKSVDMYWRYLATRELVPNGLIWKDPLSKIGTGRKVNVDDLVRAFTDDEVVKLLHSDAWKPDDPSRLPFMRDMMMAGLLTGARQQEIMRIRVKGVDVVKKTVIIPGSKNEAAPRTIPIHEALLPLFQRRVEGRKADDLIFDDLGHERSGSFATTFGRFRIACGVHEKMEGSRRSNVNYHSCRRWLSVKVIEATGDEMLAKLIQGWKRPGMVGLYARGANEIERMRETLRLIKLP